MTERQEIYFELSDAGDSVRLEPLELIKHDSDIGMPKTEESRRKLN